MGNSETTDWFRKLVSLGLLAGVLFIAWELHRGNAIAHEKTVTEVWTGWTSVNKSEYQSRLPEVFAKAMTNADELTLAEQFILNSWLTARMNTWEQDFTSATLSGGPAKQVVEEAAGDAAFMFGNKFTRGWYLENKSWISPEIVAAIDKELASTPLGSDREMFERIMKAVDAGS